MIRLTASVLALGLLLGGYSPAVAAPSSATPDGTSFVNVGKGKPGVTAKKGKKKGKKGKKKGKKKAAVAVAGFAA